MWDFRERGHPDRGQDALTFVLGAAGGFAVGMLLSGRARPERVRELGGTLRDRARDVASRFRPARLRRAVGEQGELQALEDAVLDAFLADDVLGERGIDVGAISRGIIELSGAVWTEEEAQRAVAAARRVPGVDTVVNRLDVEDDGHRHGRWPLKDDEAAQREARWTGLRSGMGRRRQGRETDPETSDDSQHQHERALEKADRDEFEWAGYAARPKMGERPEVQEGPGRVDYSEGELDNQEPTGSHTRATPQEPDQDVRNLRTTARVGEGPKPGEELRLEAADVPVKPHGSYEHGRGGEGTSGEHR